MLIDCHVHTTASAGGALAVEELVQLAKRRRLDGICITDTHRVEAALSAKRLGQELGLLVLAGFEAETDMGHFLVFVPRPEELPPIDAWLRTGEAGRLSFLSLVEAVRARDGLLVAAHPFDRQRPGACGDRLARLENLGGIEVLNGRSDRLANEMAEEMAAALGLAGLGGSDTRAQGDNLGRVATLLGGPVASEVQFIEQLRTGDAWPVEIGQPPPEVAREARPGKPPSSRRRRSRPQKSPPNLGKAKRPPDGEKARRPRRRRRGRPQR